MYLLLKIWRKKIIKSQAIIPNLLSRNKIIMRLGARRVIYFTLLELLIVISVIMILTALLLPALSKTRDKANEIKCISNLKQLSLGFSLYFGDYQDYILPYWDNGTGTWTSGSKCWYLVMENQGYIPKRELRCCPAHKDVTFPTGSYGINKYIEGAKLNKYTRPSETCLLADTLSCILRDTDLEFRHSKRMVALFLDLHMKAMRFSEVPVTTSYGHGYFWFGVK